VQVQSLLLTNTEEVLWKFQHIIPFLIYLRDGQNLRYQFDAWAA